MADSRARVHLRQIAVANHCTVDWDRMRGDDAVRFCGSCKNHVHNLSAMSEQQVDELLARSEDVCIRYYYRPDGTIVTSACPPTTRRSPSVAAAGVASALAVSGAFVGISAAVSGTEAGEVSMREDGVKVAMGMRLIIKEPKKLSPEERAEWERRRQRRIERRKYFAQLAMTDAAVSLSADDPQPAVELTMPSPAQIAPSHVWPTAVLAIGAVLALLLTSWLVFGVAVAGGAAAALRRPRGTTRR